MRYNELIQLYFERSGALQSYWTLYVVIIGGLLAFSSVRKQPDRITTLLVSVLFAIFAFENLGGIRDATVQRQAALQALRQAAIQLEVTGEKPIRDILEPTLAPVAYENSRNVHVITDLLTLLRARSGRWNTAAGEGLSESIR